MINLICISVYFLSLLALVKPLGAYIAKIYTDKAKINKYAWKIENLIYSICAIDPNKEMDWKEYLTSMLIFNFIGLICMYCLQRLQYYLPLNPQHFANISPVMAFNTAVSFVTNTNWQSYNGGETTLSYLTQMLGLTVQNFLSAATGLSLLIAFIRGLIRHESKHLGNFWSDTIRGIIYIFLPLASILAIALASQGVMQNFNHYQEITLLESMPDTTATTTHLLPMGPAASQVAIKQLGTNGGGFFSTNSAHPFENPTPLTNFLQMLAIMLLPAALCYTFGKMIGSTIHGWALLIAMFSIFIPLTAVSILAEQQGNPQLISMGIDDIPKNGLYAAGNMEGKETRFGAINSALWANISTATSSGSLNSMLDSFMPLGVISPLCFMNLGEVIFGGVGSGLYGFLILVIITVFVAGLMVGRTPEYLGKKIGIYEIKMASVTILIMPLFVLIATAISASIPAGISTIGNPQAHGFTEILYAWSSMGNNNGSMLAGLKINTPFYNILGGIIMLINRYWIAITVLALAGSLVKKKLIPENLGTLATHTPLFTSLVLSTAIMVSALSFFSALALGPIVEHIMIWSGYEH